MFALAILTGVSITFLSETLKDFLGFWGMMIFVLYVHIEHQEHGNKNYLTKLRALSSHYITELLK